MLINRWNIQPGDFIEVTDGRRGTALSVCRWIYGDIICVEVGFEWVPIDEISSWMPKE